MSILQDCSLSVNQKIIKFDFLETICYVRIAGCLHFVNLLGDWISLRLLYVNLPCWVP
jgi:hypothetical protein